MLRTSHCSAIAALMLLAAPLPALAQAVGPQLPAMPLGVDLKKTPVGSWAQYSTSVPGMPTISTRMALVERSASSLTLEATMEGGMLARVGKTAVQMVIQGDPTRDDSVKSQAIQIGNHEPMELPAQLAGAERQGFQKPNPKSLVGTETIKVAAGSFKTKHYRDKTPQGEAVDFWISEQVAPLGLVKMEAVSSGGPGMPRGAVKMELAATGKDARPTITKTPRPFDQAALMREIVGGAGGTGGAQGTAQPGKNGAAAPSGTDVGAAPAPTGKQGAGTPAPTGKQGAGATPAPSGKPGTGGTPATGTTKGGKHP